jgi:hypothetical protein
MSAVGNVHTPKLELLTRTVRRVHSNLMFLVLHRNTYAGSYTDIVAQHLRDMKIPAVGRGAHKQGAPYK